MTQHKLETEAAWVRLAHALDALDDDGLGALFGMAQYGRANLPGAVVVLVDTLDAMRHLALAMMADRKGLPLAQMEAFISDALAQGGESDGGQDRNGTARR